MTLPCYACDGHRLAAFAQSVCEDCAARLAVKRHAPPAHPTCTGCGHAFVTDWERVKHEMIGSHRYRAWSR